jgi:hypothetical protein
VVAKDATKRLRNNQGAGYYMTSEQQNDNTSSTFLAENKTIEEIVSQIKYVIDQISTNFATARELVLELARRLNETKECELGQTCRKIKLILKDKIREGRITEKWIEECLPQEYKRKYNKSEVSSLSKVGRELVQQLETGDICSKEARAEDNNQTVASSAVMFTGESDAGESDAGNLIKNNPEQSASNLLEFEFYLTFRDVRQYMASLFPKVGEGGKVWFSGIINKSTGMVTYAQPDRRERLPIEYHR